jgi:hypothetical protein
VFERRIPGVPTWLHGKLMTQLSRQRHATAAAHPVQIGVSVIEEIAGSPPGSDDVRVVRA